ncbi:Phosphoribosylglycinamide formyltransferase [hydrothermal vent metagenome]|uniref:phosphoribosylglycinamide formyltransferase 1 n=1 Tax=hydrothermal vent metagenome TaxID=652676 RepID=A0A3B1ACA5_9ZZZZ
MTTPIKIVVLISGNGSNLQAIIDEIKSGKLNAHITCVISNRADAGGLQRATAANINTQVLDHKLFDSREAFDQALMEKIDQAHPELVVLAGFMRILSDPFVKHYIGRMINIHPSLLPKHQGLNTHQRVLEAGETEHGATVHYVIPELDSGPIILQARVPVLANDDASQLANRVREIEHKIYPESIRRIATSQVTFSKGVVYYNQQPISVKQQQFNLSQ